MSIGYAWAFDAAATMTYGESDDSLGHISAIPFHVYLARNIGFPKKCYLFKTLANPTIGYTSCIKIIYPLNIVLNLPFGVIYYGLWGGWYLEKAFTINIPVVPGKVEAINWMVIEYSIRDHLAFLQTVIVEGHIEMN